MKNQARKLIGLALIAIVFICMPNSVFANYEENISSEYMISKDDIVGGWQYIVEGAPEGYGTGLLMIVKQDGMYKVQVQINGSAINGDNVVVKGKKITFNLNVEGEKVNVALEMKGSKMSGTSNSPSNGTMNISGEKIISPQ